MPTPRTPSPEQLQRERSIRFAVVTDIALIVSIFMVGILGGSLTLIAECVRGSLMTATEIFALAAMRRIHRGQLTELEFGHGKLEQIANLVIAAGLFLGATWISFSALSLAFGDHPPGTPAGLALGAMFAMLNLYLNGLAWLAVLQQTPEGSPVIMEGQLRARTVKLSSSGVVLVLLTVSACFVDPVVGKWCDAGGALFVATFMFANAWDMLRGGLPDLLDQCASEAVQLGINRALARHFDDYDRFERVRSRRSGQTVFVEVTLGFPGHITVAELERRIGTITAAFRAEIAQAEVSIVVASAPAAAPPPLSGLGAEPAPT